MTARVAIIMNPRSGSSPDRKELDRALGRAGVDADVHCVPDAPDASAWMMSIARWYDVIVAAGGDGTASNVAEAVLTEGKVFGVIPTGTMNHFARDLQIPLEVDAAIAVLAAGHVRALDAGDVNGLVFLNNASIGAYPRLVWARDRARLRGIPRSFAHPLAVVRTWLKLRTLAVRLCLDGQELIRRTPFVFVGNSEYEVEGTQLGRRRTMTDGRLSLYVAPDVGRIGSLALPARALLRKLKQHDKFEIHRASSISMDLARQRVSVALDGEVKALESPLQFTVRRKALRTIVPPAGDR
jgi:diacylglycerol kinase family enzyme